MFCKISWLGSGFNTSSGTYTETHADKMTKLAHTCIYNSTYLSHIVFSLSLYLYLSHYILLGLFVVCIILCSFSKQKLYILPPWTKAGMIGGDIGGRLLIWRHRRLTWKLLVYRVVCPLVTSSLFVPFRVSADHARLVGQAIMCDNNLLKIHVIIYVLVHVIVLLCPLRKFYI